MDRRRQLSRSVARWSAGNVPAYHVDTTESRSRGKRSDEQAAYFGITHEQSIELGQQAKAFTANALAKPFTIYTPWRPVFGPKRFYGIVYTSDGEDLAELLVKKLLGANLRHAHGATQRQRLAQLSRASRENRGACESG